MCEVLDFKFCRIYIRDDRVVFFDLASCHRQCPPNHVFFTKDKPNVKEMMKHFNCYGIMSKRPSLLERLVPGKQLLDNDIIFIAGKNMVQLLFWHDEATDYKFWVEMKAVHMEDSDSSTLHDTDPRHYPVIKLTLEEATSLIYRW